MDQLAFLRLVVPDDLGLAAFLSETPALWRRASFRSMTLSRFSGSTLLDRLSLDLRLHQFRQSIIIAVAVMRRIEFAGSLLDDVACKFQHLVIELNVGD